MKCLSLKQPFAELIVTGKKTIELRRWKTKFRGEFLVHASQKVLKDECKRLGLDPKLLVTGAIIGKAEIYNIKEYDHTNENDFLKDENKHFSDGRNFYGINGFLLRNAVKFDKPIPYKGQLNLFEVKLDLESL